MAAEAGVSHTALLRHVRRGIVRDDENGRFYPESADRVRHEIAVNRLNKHSLKRANLRRKWSTTQSSGYRPA